MNWILYVTVIALDKISNVHCFSEEYTDSGPFSSEYTDYQTEYESSEYDPSDLATSYETEEYTSYETEEETSFESHESDASDDDIFSSSNSFERYQLKMGVNENGVIDNKIIDRFISEVKAGSPADLFGTNQHYRQPNAYKDLSRRFVLQYPYTEVQRKPKISEAERLTPKLASPELVLAVAKKSAVLQASKPLKPTNEKTEKDILRTGEYWNDVWREDVKPENLLRTQKQTKDLKTIHVNIMPGSSLYEVVSRLKEKSPRLLYIINNKHKEK